MNTMKLYKNKSPNPNEWNYLILSENKFEYFDSLDDIRGSVVGISPEEFRSHEKEIQKRYYLVTEFDRFEDLREKYPEYFL